MHRRRLVLAVGLVLSGSFVAAARDDKAGVVPDVVATPTIAGIRAGKDEVLEAAVQKLLGRGLTDVERAALDVAH